MMHCLEMFIQIIICRYIIRNISFTFINVYTWYDVFPVSLLMISILLIEYKFGQNALTSILNEILTKQCRNTRNRIEYPGNNIDST